jgi:hypothetical protein
MIRGQVALANENLDCRKCPILASFFRVGFSILSLPCPFYLGNVQKGDSGSFPISSVWPLRLPQSLKAFVRLSRLAFDYWLVTQTKKSELL